MSISFTVFILTYKFYIIYLSRFVGLVHGGVPGKPSKTKHTTILLINFLKKIFTNKQLEKNKYEFRPFIGLENTLTVFSFPEQTIHNNKKYDLCFYFKDNKHCVGISSLLYVPLEFR
jgi:hypothetical protein